MLPEFLNSDYLRLPTASNNLHIDCRLRARNSVREPLPFIHAATASCCDNRVKQELAMNRNSIRALIATVLLATAALSGCATVGDESSVYAGTDVLSQDRMTGA